MCANSFSHSRNALSFPPSFVLQQLLHHLINGDNFQQSSVTCKLAQVVASEMKIDSCAFLILVQIICKRKEKKNLMFNFMGTQMRAFHWIFWDDCSSMSEEAAVVQNSGCYVLRVYTDKRNKLVSHNLISHKGNIKKEKIKNKSNVMLSFATLNA